MYINTKKYYNSPQIYRILIVRFIRDYILSFYQMYMIAKYSIYLLVMNNSNTSYDFKTMPMESNYLESDSKTVFKMYADFDMHIRKRMIYYSLLMKYSVLALDHITKKFEIIITENSISKKYGKNNYNSVKNNYHSVKKSMYEYYADIEKKQDEYFTQSAFKRTTTIKQVPMYVKYNNRNLGNHLTNKSIYITKKAYNTGVSSLETISKTPEYATKVGHSALETISKTPQYLGKVRNSALKSISKTKNTIYKKFVPEKGTFRNLTRSSRDIQSTKPKKDFFSFTRK